MLPRGPRGGRKARPHPQATAVALGKPLSTARVTHGARGPGTRVAKRPWGAPAAGDRAPRTTAFQEHGSHAHPHLRDRPSLAQRAKEGSATSATTKALTAPRVQEGCDMPCSAARSGRSPRAIIPIERRDDGRHPGQDSDRRPVPRFGQPWIRLTIGSWTTPPGERLVRSPLENPRANRWGRGGAQARRQSPARPRSLGRRPGSVAPLVPAAPGWLGRREVLLAGLLAV